MFFNVVVGFCVCVSGMLPDTRIVFNFESKTILSKPFGWYRSTDSHSYIRTYTHTHTQRVFTLTNG